MDQLQQIFRPHQFGDTRYVDLYHVYDNLSQTPFLHGDGISCGDPDDYIMNAWHVIMPLAMRRHLNWQNRISTQFISFYNNEADARREAQRRVNQRWVPGVGDNEPVRRAQLLKPLLKPGGGLCCATCGVADQSSDMERAQRNFSPGSARTLATQHERPGFLATGDAHHGGSA